MGLLLNLHLKPSTFRRTTGAALAAFALLSSSAAFAQAQAPASANIPSYFEFGTVVFLGAHNIDIQTFDQKKQRNVQYSFVLGSNTRKDDVHVGDTVEVIYAPTGIDWVVRRLVLLTTGIPVEGPPADGYRAVPAPVNARLTPAPAPGRAPATAAVASGAAKTSAPATATTHNVAIPAAKPGAGGKTPAAGSVALGTAAPANGKTPTAGQASIDLGAGPPAKPPSAVSATLALGEVIQPKALTAKEVSRERPAEECNRSSEDWPKQPLRLAILDFRYPTEREEAHDHGNTGGGSGTAVADLVYDRLDQLNEFGMIRGDRTKLYRADFAGAARVGREIGADAVLAGTFQPVDPPPGSDPDFPPPKSYELRAGIVDTCTGQLLMRLVSVQCPPGLDPNQPMNAASCTRHAVTAKQASDPKDQVSAFKVPIEAMLYPLVHNGPPPGTEGSAGVVTVATDANVTIKVVPGANLKTGEQVAIHAWRLTKNPSTYTLHNLHDEEIGRLTLTTVQGSSATGTYVGDFPPKPGDTAELVTEAPASVGTPAAPAPVRP